MPIESYGIQIHRALRHYPITFEKDRLFLFGKIVGKVKVWGLNPDIVLALKTKDSFHRAGRWRSLSDWSCHGDGLGHNCTNGSCLGSNTDWSSWLLRCRCCGCCAGRTASRQGAWNCLLLKKLFWVLITVGAAKKSSNYYATGRRYRKEPTWPLEGNPPEGPTGRFTTIYYAPTGATGRNF